MIFYLSHYFSIFSVKAFISEINGKVYAHDSKIYKIHRKNVGEISRDYLRADSRNVAENNKHNKGKAHSLRAFRFKIAVRIYRPGHTKANEHYHFQQFRHNKNLQKTSNKFKKALTFSYIHIILHSDIYVKYIFAI